MSHYTTVDLEVKDLECFINALLQSWPTPLTKEEIEVHGEPQNLYGYQGDIRDQRANIIIRRKQVGRLSNDIGFLVKDGKMTAYISEFDQKRYSSKWLNTVRQNYSINTVEKTAQRKGLRTQRFVNEQGKTVIRVASRG